VDVQGAGGRAQEQAAQLVGDLVVALGRDVDDVAERAVGMDAGADERAAGVAQARAATAATPASAVGDGGDASSASAEYVSGWAAPSRSVAVTPSSTSTPVCDSACVRGSTAMSSSSTPSAKSRPGAPKRTAGTPGKLVTRALG
jgi:hypothetical protein